MRPLLTRFIFAILILALSGCVERQSDFYVTSTEIVVEDVLEEVERSNREATSLGSTNRAVESKLESLESKVEAVELLAARARAKAGLKE